MSTDLDAALDALDASLAAAERHSAILLAQVRSLRRHTATGALAGLPRKLDQLRSAAEMVTSSAASAAGAFEFDDAAAFTDGTYLKALFEAANEKGVTLVDRDGRITCFPILLKLEPSIPAVRIGRKLERQLRPSVLASLLKQAQEKSAFNAEAFLELLFRAATHLARESERADEPRPGAVVPLLDIYDLLTLRPGAASDYPREAFAVDVLRLDRLPDTRTRRGYGFRLPASTGTKGRSRLTVYDESGVEHVYVGVAFQANGEGA
jgi:hypothetical protein